MVGIKYFFLLIPQVLLLMEPFYIRNPLIKILQRIKGSKELCPFRARHLGVADPESGTGIMPGTALEINPPVGKTFRHWHAADGRIGHG